MRPGLLGILVAGCHGAVTVDIASDRPIPQGLDAMCVGVADRASSGGHFGRQYQLEGKLATLPQSLRVEPGGASAALAWVRGARETGWPSRSIRSCRTYRPLAAAVAWRDRPDISRT